jgi:signal transduction histidine kinase
MYWWAFLFADFILLLHIPVVMLTPKVQSRFVVNSQLPPQKIPSVVPRALPVINGCLLMHCPGKRFAMFSEKFIRRALCVLTVPYSLISLLIGESVSWANNTGAVDGPWRTSNNIIGAESQAFLGGQVRLMYFVLLLLLFATVIGLVLGWRRKRNFFRKEIQRAERKVQEVLEICKLQHTEHEAVLDTVSDLVMFLSPDQKITWVNRRAESALGMEFASIIGRSCHEIWHTLIGDGFLCPGRKCLLSGVPERSIGWTREKKQFDIWAVPVRDSSGDVVSIIEIGRDITASSRFEQQLRHLQKMESIGWLTTGIVHDFNNILTGIIGFSYLLQKKDNGDEQARNYLANIISAADRAEIITRTFLAFTRSQSVSFVPEDLNDVIRGVEGLLCRVLGEDVDLGLNLPETKIPVLADSLLLGQVLLNIAVHSRNAMSASGDFVISTDVTSQTCGDCDGVFVADDQNACLHIEIPRTKITSQGSEALQEMFSSSVSFGEGVDLGLAVARGIVEQHGGSISFSSETGSGSVFTIHLPLYQRAGHESRKEKTSIALSGEKEIILVVEDDKWSRSFLREFFEGFGYGIIEAGDAVEAKEKFRHHGSNIALVLCDLVIPKMNGRELCRELARTRPDLKVLFMSGYPGDAIRARGIGTDGITILSKPFKPEVLLHVVRSVLNVAG